MRVGYCRVSTKEQAVNSHALEQQIERIKSQRVEKVYFDIDSGRKSKRVQYQQLLQDIQEGLITEIIITRLDRLTRSLADQIKTFTILEQYGVQLIALDQKTDFSTASGKLTLNMLGAIAQNESDLNSERTRHGYEYFRKQHKVHSVPLGYRVVDNNCFIDDIPFLCNIHDKKEYSKFTIARLVIDYFLDEKSLHGCLTRLNIYFGLQRLSTKQDKYSLSFSKAGLDVFFHNPMIRGHLAYFHRNKTKETVIIYNNHPPILTDLEYQEICDIIAHNRKVRGFGKIANYPLSGLIYCSSCQFSMRALKSFRNHTNPQLGHNYYYQCYNCRTGNCNNKKMIRMDVVESSLIDIFRQKYRELTKLSTTTTKIINPQIIELLQQITTLKSLPKNPAIDEAIDKLEAQIKELEFNQNNQDLSVKENQEYLKSIFSSFGFWDSLLPEQRKEIYHKLVSKIIVKDGKIQDIILKI
ncbi:fdxN element excision recombinase XisF [Cyanobacterium sp. Dongsha4]|uniref:fdxN element excision recombinase XisF n=1 Tax=Cyanobacterium sp. DS4 TaxID=2878255 RepID=UPI002E7FDCC6|nr:fdxN element excision recombinase XisF [Cyanobacterium sp. Dongsha4]WVL00394.1 recombinase family protein [Cyanobacterium sp. Dongsha4]